MTTYYVRTSGNDANAGTSPAQAWATIGKALGAAGIASGDTLYIGGGTYRETVTVAMVSATAETKVIGDGDGSHTGDPGDIIWTACTTDDKTAPAAARPLDLNGRDFLTFTDILFNGGSVVTSATIRGTIATSFNITFRRCLFTVSRGAGLIQYTGVADVPANWLFDACIFVPPNNQTAVTATWAASAVADYDVGFSFTNCLFLFGAAAAINLLGSTGGLAFKPGGVKVYNCTFLGPATALATSGTDWSTSIPCLFYNNVARCGSTCLIAGATGQIVEDYNHLFGAANYTNVNPGAHSHIGGSANVQDYAWLLELGQGRLWGRPARPFGSPMKGAPILGFGAQPGGPATDMLGAVRPAGGGSPLFAIGAFERGNTFGRETGTVRTGTSALSITGPGYQDFDVPVDAVATTVSIWVRRDATYAGTNPQLKVLNGTECGVADATATAAGAAGAWEQLSLAFTPTAKGIVTIRVRSNDTNGGGKMFADDFAVA